MEYADLLAEAINDFYENDMPFPSDLLYPIPAKNRFGRVADMFMYCRIRRDPDDNIIDVGEPDVIYQREIAGPGRDFVKINPTEKPTVKNVNFDNGRERGELVGIGDFESAYMLLRERAFGNMLSEPERKALKTIIAFYDIQAGQPLKRIYHRYAEEFFIWAYSKL